MLRVAVVGAIFLVGCSGRTEISQSEKPLALRERASHLKLKFPLRRVFLRAFKGEKLLELWAANGNGPMALVRQYAIAAASGGPGPKRREGDFQVPEGVYRIDRFNPNSRFHLSMGLDYPNASDRMRSDRKRPGSDIFIHGNRVSIGCMAMTDPVIEEIYSACRSAVNAKSIPVHVFPCRMDGPSMRDLEERYPQHAGFWSELRPIYDAFQVEHQIPKIRITKSGIYRIVW